MAVAVRTGLPPPARAHTTAREADMQAKCKTDDRRSLNQRYTRCGHHFCTDCKTRRGNNRYNRRVRHAVRIELRTELKLVGAI